MKKKTERKKLVLAKETVKRLDEGPVGVVGGVSDYSNCIYCYTERSPCDAVDTAHLGCHP